MKRKNRLMVMRLSMALMAVSLLGGCGAYARTPNSSSGVEMYGVIDVGVQHDSR